MPDLSEPHIESALNLLRLVRGENEAIGCAVSFGKDSLATLDLCCQVFGRVEAYYLFRVRDLDMVRSWADEVLKRTGVRVRMYPHFDLARSYRYHVLQPHWRLRRESVPALRMADIDAAFRLDAAVGWIAYGWRRNDSFSRALIMKKTAGYDPQRRVVYPLRSWRRQQVYDYLDARGIARPPTLGRKEQGGLDFHPEAFAALSTEDRRRWLADFPFTEAQLAEKVFRRVEQAQTTG
jgi:3'-phosphoadenosine 5'-phosphosulfate sulfotransferase (PAPS reductase)/FAD synthetase